MAAIDGPVRMWADPPPNTSGGRFCGPEPTAETWELEERLAAFRRQFGLPALGCVVVRSNVIAGIGAVGVRKSGTGETVTRADRWHVGSLTKSMTASLAGRMVDEGLIRWDTTLADVFSERGALMSPGWRGVTLGQLLAHRGGAPGDLTPGGLWSALWIHPGTPWEQRDYLLDALTVPPPPHAPGTCHRYSNAGYALAGAMLERVAGQPWEGLITERLFRPLGMGSAGFGVPATPRHVDEPWGHVWREGTAVPVPPGPEADNPPGIGPGGTVHVSLEDLARHAAFHLGDGAGLIRKETMERLHADMAGQGYALGWGVTYRDWAGGVALHHTGSNTQWFANLWLAPARRFAVAVVTNLGGAEAFRATDAVAAEMIRLFLADRTGASSGR